MRPNIPNGGFLVAKDSRVNVFDQNNKLNDSGAETRILNDHGLLFAVWREFQGQGLWTLDHKAVVAYDVDLTNQRELEELAGLSDKGHHDLGYVLWTLYKKFELGLLYRLRGAFGFALWDAERNKILVATDAFGIKPVVYYNKPDRFIAASRIRHIKLQPGISSDIDPEAIYHYLFFHAICSPNTIYKEIRKLEPGKALTFENHSLKSFTHYDIRYCPDLTKTKEHWLNEIPTQIEKAVGKFIPLSSYENAGCFLSGGTDSSSIAGYYTKLSGKPAKTFSIGFDHPKYNELDFARVAVDHYGTAQKEYYVTPQDVLSLIEDLPRIYDEPFGNSSVVPAYYCARIARESNVEVLLGGDGGDEIFGGNERYVTNLLFERYFLLPQTFRLSFFEPMLAKLPDYDYVYKAKRYIRRANIPNPRRFFSYNLLAEKGSKKVLNPDFLSTFDENCFMNLAREHYNRIEPAHVTDRLLYIDMKFTITDNDLRKVNQMAEAAGVRVRYPLLDRDLVDFTTTIPPNLKVKFGKNRYIFKQAMKNFLPMEIIKKQKHGMGLPIAFWLKTDARLMEMLRDSLFIGKPSLLNYVSSDFIDEIRQSFKKETSPFYGDNLWVYLVLELWLKKNRGII